MPSKFDYALIQSLLVGSVGALSYYFAGALGAKQLSKMIRFVTILIIINLAAGVTWEGITAIRDKVNGIADAISGFADKFSFLTERPDVRPLTEHLPEIEPLIEKEEIWDWLTRFPKKGGN